MAEARTKALLVLSCALIICCVSCEAKCGTGHGQSMLSGANDVIVVENNNGVLRSSSVNVQVGKLKAGFYGREGKQVHVRVNGIDIDLDDPLMVGENGVVCFAVREHGTFFSEELDQMELRRGKNPGLFIVQNLNIEIKFDLYLMDQKDLLVVTDIDGTITKSDHKGFFLPIMGIDHHQKYVIELFQSIGLNGYTLIYLTARSVGWNDQTRKYLFEKLQNKKGVSLPYGPVLASPNNVQIPLEVEGPSDTKAKAIRDIEDKFNLGSKAVVGAYGNQKSDLDAYLKSGINANLTYIANEEGELSNPVKNSTYKEHYEHVDDMYPPSVPKGHLIPW